MKRKIRVSVVEGSSGGHCGACRGDLLGNWHLKLDTAGAGFTLCSNDCEAAVFRIAEALP